jgi:nitrate/nitrite transport system substrate-binding protein
MAVLEAQAWCDKLENREEMCKIVGTRAWFNVPVADILPRQKGEYDYGIDGKVVKDSPGVMKFWRDHASFPFKSHDLWFVTENIRWGKFESATDAKALVDKVNRADLWREAAKTLGLGAGDIPASDSRGKETFFDGKVFDPENPQAYLASLPIKRIA